MNIISNCLAIFNILIIILIKIYQYCISPYLGSNCRFQPTCSAYALASFKKYNFFIALKLTITRLIKCHPFGAKGYDPLPKIGTK